MVVRFDDAEKFIACGHNNGNLTVVSLESQAAYRVFNTSLMRNPVTCLRWLNSSSDPVAVSANAEGSLKGYSVLSGTPRFSIESPKGASHFLCFDLDPSCSSLVVGDNHGDLLVYDRLTLKKVRTFSRASWFSNGHFNRVD